MNIKDVAERAYKNAVMLGKIGDRTGSQKLGDVYSEYIEAVGALRGGQFSDWEGFRKEGYEEIGNGDLSIAKTVFEKYIKDSYEDELTDLLFVVLTLMKDCGMDIEKHIEAKMKYNKLREDHK